MRTMPGRVIHLAVITTLWLGPVGSLVASGPWFVKTVFVETHVPDRPLANFAAGKLGVIDLFSGLPLHRVPVPRRDRVR